MNLSKRLAIILLVLILIIPSKVTLAETNVAFLNTVNISTWLWDTQEIVSNPDNIIKFLEENNVNVLYLQIDYNLKNDYYNEFISEASKVNISIQALDGSPDWVCTDGENLQNTFFDWVTQYQKSSLENQRFKGIHLDVEPYENGKYLSDPNLVIQEYQEYILRAKKRSNKLDLNLGIDIPFWFYGTKYNTQYGNGNLAEWIFKKIKTVSIMAYRDIALGENGIINIAKREMNLCEKYNVQATIAVETGKLTECGAVTFYEEGEACMYNQLNIVYKKYSNNVAFNGFAIHYLDSWMNMKN
ncbi:hypothetical protein [Clostridium sp.]|uniref:hypothetical protein n=1 Tax=Clostridium sp. TaxID=1506 RepID=UPI003D6DA39E